MQRLTIFLGNPGYSLSVVLFTLFTFSALGSLLTDFLDRKNLIPSPAFRMAIICLVIVVAGLLTPVMIENCMSADILTRVLLAIGILSPLGLVTGTAFPTGMRLSACRAPDLSAWLLGINGAASVLCSVLAVLVSIYLGISFSYYLSCLWYAIAALAALASTCQEPVNHDSLQTGGQA